MTTGLGGPAISPVLVVAWAFFVTLAGISLGGVLARAARLLLGDPVRLRRRAVVASVVASVTCAAVAATVGSTTQLPAWDVVWFGSIAVAVAAVSALQPRRAQLAALALGALMSLGACELVARLGRGFSPYLHAPAVALREDAYALEFYCELVDDKPREVAPPVAAGWRTQAQAGEGPLVVHMGDSMLVSRPTGGFVSQLAQALASIRQVNAGTFGTSADFVARVIPTWIQPLSPDLVVYYPFAGNDLIDLTIGRLCFGPGQVSCPAAGGLRELPPRPDERIPFSMRLPRGATPTAIRLLAHWSAAASLLDEALHRAANRLLPVTVPQCEAYSTGAAQDVTRLRHYEQAATLLRDRVHAMGSELLVVVLPYRTDLERVVDGGELRGRDTSEQLVEIWRSLGVETIDAWPWFEEALRTHPEHFWLHQGSGYGDFHLGEEGDALVAQHMEPVLAAWRDRRSTAERADGPAGP